MAVDSKNFGSGRPWFSRKEGVRSGDLGVLLRRILEPEPLLKSFAEVVKGEGMEREEGEDILVVLGMGLVLGLGENIAS